LKTSELTACLPEKEGGPTKNPISRVKLVTKIQGTLLKSLKKFFHGKRRKLGISVVG
jgi:hypothetical protein